MSNSWNFSAQLDSAYSEKTVEIIIKKGSSLGIKYFAEYGTRLIEESEALTMVKASIKNGPLDDLNSITVKIEEAMFNFVFSKNSNYFTIDFLPLSTCERLWEKRSFLSDRLCLDVHRYIKLLLILCNDFAVHDISYEILY